MNRRELLRIGTAALTAAVGGCLGTRQPTTARSTTTASCPPPPDEPLVELLPPAPANRDRTVDADASQAYLDEYDAVASVSAEYRDSDDDVLDDATVRIIRFREDAAARRVIIGQLNSIEFDSGRVGVGVLVGRIGLIAAAPQRDRARSLLATSPGLSQRCLDRHEVLPSRTRTPGSDDDSPKATETST